MSQEKIYEVLNFDTGGFFVYGGSLSGGGQNYFKEKGDADLVCEALNMMEILKMRSTLSKLDDVIYSLQTMQKHLNIKD